LGRQPDPPDRKLGVRGRDRQVRELNGSGRNERRSRSYELSEKDGMTLSMESRSWFEPLVHQFQRPAFRFAMMLTLDRPTADEVVRNASDRELIAALRALNLRERQAIYLRYYEDEPFAQIGDILGVREGTARVIVSRALDKMRRRLNSSEEMTEVLA